MSLKSQISYWLFNKKGTEINNRKFIEWNTIEQISIVLFSSQYKEINEFIKTAKKDNKQILLYIIHLDNTPINFNIEEKHIILTKKQFNFFGVLNSTFSPLDNQSNNSVLINLGLVDEIHAMCVSKQLKANCKISKFKHALFDICITQETQLTNTEFLKQVVVYLNMIKTK